MTGIVERVARAIAPDAWDPDNGQDMSAADAEAWRSASMEQARRALAVMREDERGVIARLRNGNLNVSGRTEDINALLRLHIEAANAIERLHLLHEERAAIMRDADHRVELRIAENDALRRHLEWCRNKLATVALNDELEERLVGLVIDCPRCHDQGNG